MILAVCSCKIADFNQQLKQISIPLLNIHLAAKRKIIFRLSLRLYQLQKVASRYHSRTQTIQVLRVDLAVDDVYSFGF